MIAVLDLPGPIFEAPQGRADEQGSRVEAVILQVSERAIEPKRANAKDGSGVRLPLVASNAGELSVR